MKSPFDKIVYYFLKMINIVNVIVVQIVGITLHKYFL
nr:MAG TPA: hypothetical protein [Caudoviricetes sp.]